MRRYNGAESRHPRSAPIRIAFILTQFEVGGAEMMLWKLLSRIDRRRFDPMVIALSARSDSMLGRFEGIGVQCRLVGMNAGIGGFRGLLRLRRIFLEFRPNIVQGWMYHANLAATLANSLTGDRVPVLWNVRGALIERAHQKRLSSLIVWASGRLSRTPEWIVNNSLASALEHEAHVGYPVDKRLVVPNGFDLDEFHPASASRLVLRKALGIGPDEIVVGLIGRYHPMKDHANFLRAAAMLRRTHPEVQYVLAGENVDAANQELHGMVVEMGLSGCVHLLGLRADMPEITAALDIATSSSSSGEGFPNVIGEAMSCAVPCVVTDVGDSAAIVGDTGRSVPPRDAVALARAICDLVEMPPAERRALGVAARQRVRERYSLDAVVGAYEALYLNVHQKFYMREVA